MKIENKLLEINTNVVCNVVTCGEKAYLIKDFEKSLYITPDDNEANQMYEMLKSFGLNVCLINFFDGLFESAKFKNKDFNLKIINLLSNLDSFDAIVCSKDVFCYFVPNQENVNSNIIQLSVGSSRNLESLIKELIALNYTRVETVENMGEFSLFGDRLDIFVTNSNNPIKINFFDDEIESIYSYDITTKFKINDLQNVKIIFNKLCLLDEEENELIIEKISNHNNKFFEEILQGIVNNLKTNSELPLEFILPFSNGKFSSLFDELIKGRKLFVYNSLNIFREINNMICELKLKINSLFNFEETKNIFKNLLENIKNNEKKLKNTVFFENIIDFSHRNYKKINYDVVTFNNFLYNLDLLKIELNPYIQKKKKIIICLKDEETLNSISEIFKSTGTPFSLGEYKSGLNLSTQCIPYNICFDSSDEFYIGYTNFAYKKVAKKSKSRSVTFLPKAGDYVVHSVHGIGKCEGIVSIKTSNVSKDYYKILYRGGDCLYVPTFDTSDLSQYISDEENPKLNKLGGKEFANSISQAKKSIEDISKELLQLQAKRNSIKGFKFAEDDYLFTEFENAFPYEETEDQLKAISDIKNDMISGKVMDRLICGDVGFGKTEVAMRAIFKAVVSGKQVAFLCPTTVLSLQHYNSLIERFKDFGVSVEMLNRFVSKSKQTSILQDLKNGKVNVLVGTHRLLSEDVKFFDLGLLVLDEEQRFGVKAKEKIKELKNNVAVLMLSATPIPRTLNMALLSLRDISVINTPPKLRSSVKTYAVEFDLKLVCDAIRFELNRGGQVFIVYNNIDEIYNFKSKLANEFSDTNYTFDVAHGQMNKNLLEDAVKRLYDKSTDVFISTTIIENGIDIPNANTIIVLDSHKLGLAQMYQLRGRVGRSSVKAFAYFTYPKNMVLTEEANKRLEAIVENTELGSGFKLAMRDLQIRGAGEILGKNQHGHIVKIGYDMYLKLIEEAVSNLKGEKVVNFRPVKIDVEKSYSISENYIGSEAERVSIYAKISKLDDKTEMSKLLNDIELTYGKLQDDIVRLCNLGLLANLAKRVDAKLITIQKNKAEICFYEDVNKLKILENLKSFSNLAVKNSSNLTIILLNYAGDIDKACSLFIDYFESMI